VVQSTLEASLEALNLIRILSNSLPKIASWWAFSFPTPKHDNLHQVFEELDLDHSFEGARLLSKDMIRSDGRKEGTFGIQT
jgi:hypothetical protein